MRIVHFVGFRDDRYNAARKIWGEPHYIHPGWDLRAAREIAEDDLVVFACGEHDQIPRTRSYSDILDGSQPFNTKGKIV